MTTIESINTHTESLIYPITNFLCDILSTSSKREWWTKLIAKVTHIKLTDYTHGFLTQDLFHSTSLATWGSIWASKEAKFFKELTFLGFVRYFSAKIKQSSKMSNTELKNAHLGLFFKLAQFWLKSSAKNKE